MSKHEYSNMPPETAVFHAVETSFVFHSSDFIDLWILHKKGTRFSAWHA